MCDENTAFQLGEGGSYQLSLLVEEKKRNVAWTCCRNMNPFCPNLSLQSLYAFDLWQPRMDVWPKKPTDPAENKRGQSVCSQGLQTSGATCLRKSGCRSLWPPLVHLFPSTLSFPFKSLWVFMLLMVPVVPSVLFEMHWFFFFFK